MSRSNIRADLKAIVDNFRVSELVTVCTVAGVSRNGKKTELLSRIYNLIRDPVPSHVEKKILELCKICLPNLQIPAPPGRPEANANARSNFGPSSFQIPKPPPTNNRPVTYEHLQNMNQVNMSAGLKKQMQHANSPAGVDQHPDVRFKVIPFFDLLDVIFKPLCLTAHNVNSTYQDAYFQFTLTPNHLDQIQKSAKINVFGANGSIVDKTPQVQVQMRFCMMETSCEQLDNYPPYINVRVNSKAVELPPVLPQSKAGQPPKRSPKPLNVTKYIRFENQVNHVQIQWTTEFARTWVCAVFLVKENDSALLLQRLKQKGPRSKDHTRALIKDKLKIDPDSEIAMTTLRISLKCPLGVCRMTMPVRSKLCSHVQCFDASFYVKMNEKRPCWQCPVCSKDAPFADLQLDGYFLEVLESSTYECTEIFCYDNGSWEPIDGDKKNLQTLGNSSQPSKSANTAAAAATSKEPTEVHSSPVKVEDSPNRTSEKAEPENDHLAVKGRVVAKEEVKGELGKTEGTDATTGDEEEQPPEIVDLCSDSEDETPAPPARPESAISLSSASPADLTPNRLRIASPFPSPPLMPTIPEPPFPLDPDCDRLFSVGGKAAYETRKRSHHQINAPSPNGFEEPAMKTSVPTQPQSRAFLNPALIASTASITSNNRATVMTSSQQQNLTGPTFLQDAAPFSIAQTTSLEAYNRSKINPTPHIQTYNPYGIDSQTLSHTSMQPVIPPPPSKPGVMSTRSSTATSAAYPQINNSFFPPPPAGRPKEFNIIELE